MLSYFVARMDIASLSLPGRAIGWFTTRSCYSAELLHGPEGALPALGGQRWLTEEEGAASESL